MKRTLSGVEKAALSGLLLLLAWRIQPLPLFAQELDQQVLEYTRQAIERDVLTRCGDSYYLA